MSIVDNDKIARLLGVDEVATVGTIRTGITVKLRFRNYWGQVDVVPSMAPRDIGKLLMDLAASLKASQFSLDRVQGEDLDQIALELGVSTRGGSLTADGMRKSLATEHRCGRCGHPSKMHGRDRRLACNIWGCDCLDYVDPPSDQDVAQARVLMAQNDAMTIDELRAEAGLPPLSNEDPPPAGRFEAIAMELFK